MTKILCVLRTHRCLASLPKKSVTLLQTPRIFTGQILDVFPGQYLHLSLEQALINILNRTQQEFIPSEKLVIDFNIDGCEFNKKCQIIPIQVRVSNIPNSDPENVGVYKDRRKPVL